jgi:hypothetical protein
VNRVVIILKSVITDSYSYFDVLIVKIRGN